MAALRVILLVSTYLAVLNTIYHPPYAQATVVVTPDEEGETVAEDVEVQFGSPPPPPQQPGMDENMVVAEERFAQMISGRMSYEDIMVCICHKLPRDISVCRQYPDLITYMDQHSDRFPNIAPTGRKRRFASSFHNPSSWFGPSSYNSFNNGWNFGFNSPSFGSFQYPSPSPSPVHQPTVHQPSRPSFSRNVFICPTPLNQSMIYQLSPDSAPYPAADIGTELARADQAVLLNCLMREFLLSTTPPFVVVDDFRLTANVTCPLTQLRLYGYQSQTQARMCFVLQNFDDFVFYRECLQRLCRNCTDKVQTHQSGYGSFNFHSQNQMMNTTSQKLCITDYRATSFWAYCPTLPAGSRIVRDRIILPIACSCQSIACDRVQQW